MKVALVSLDQSWKDKQSNQRKCKAALEKIKAACCDIDLVIFPELTMTGFCIDDPRLAENCTDEFDTTEFFSELSISYQCHIVFGLLASLGSKKIVNRQVVTARNGELVSYYDKMHTFSYAGESEYISQGDRLTLFSVDGTSVGSSICYDLRFAELYRCYRDKAEIVINIANWPSTRSSQWRCLLQARAIENQYFMIGVNRTGSDGKGLHYDNSSMIFSPLGELLSPIFQGSEWAIYDINVDEVKSVRDKFPFVEDRREQLYRNLACK